MKRIILLLCIIAFAVSSCKKEAEPEEGKVYYPIEEGVYNIEGQLVVVSLELYSSAIIVNCLDFPIKINMRFWGDITTYELHPNESILFDALNNGGYLSKSTYFSIDFGPYGTLSRGTLPGGNTKWYHYFEQSYSNCEEVFRTIDTIVGEKWYTIAYKAKYITYPIDERLLKFLSDSE